MYKICHDEIKILNYLKEKIYFNLPKRLWDRHLFLYDKLVKIMDYTFIEPEHRADNITFYIYEDVSIEGIVCKEIYVDKINFYIYGKNHSLIVNFLHKEIYVVNKFINIYVIEENLKNDLLKEFNGDLISGQIKFYKNGGSEESLNYNCYTINKEHLTLQSELSYLKYAIQFIPFYGSMYKDRFASTCGVAPITSDSAEIISVNTYDKELRGKGLAKAVCLYAIKEASRTFKTFTWTADEENYASRALASSLGFKEYMKKYCIRVR